MTCVNHFKHYTIMRFIRIKREGKIEVCVGDKAQWILCCELACIKSAHIALDQENAILQILANKELLKSISQEIEQSRHQAIVVEQQDLMLPCDIKSLRDFMLFEQHVIDATRGYVKRFLPGKYKILKRIEQLSGKPPKALRPKPLWYNIRYITWETT